MHDLLKDEINLKNPYSITANEYFDEAKLLKLCCDNALLKLKWEPTLSYQETVEFIGDWYKKYIKSESDFLEITVNQIRKYQDFAEKQGKLWAS